MSDEHVTDPVEDDDEIPDEHVTDPLDPDEEDDE